MNTREAVRRQKWRLRIIRHAGEESKNVRYTCRHFGISPQTYYKWFGRYEEQGPEGLFDLSHRPKSIGPPVADDKSTINAVFRILHSPPRDHGINRTSWRITDIRTCVEADGIPISKHTIRKILKNAGYTFKKARTVLTSHDPEYGRKLKRIRKVLASLAVEDRFFSIDEFGPFAVKTVGGRRLVGPREHPTVPQFQKSRGSVIVTAALELTSNQISHFFSARKNTDETIRLMEQLIGTYKGCHRLYFSWDHASWHSSQKLKSKVIELNRAAYRRANGTAKVIVLPLPKSAQFLNVIESVFSGMARAIIHNSDYENVEEAMIAVDKYIAERNLYFQNHPKSAGNRIWGNEPAVSRFSESQNCKDSRFR